MTPVQFEKYLRALKTRYGQTYEQYAPTIAARVAVEYFKNSFQTESWERKKWKDVKRRTSGFTRGAASMRKILTGTGDLGRSIEQDASRTGKGQAVVHTNPSKFANSQKIYAAVHNEGLRAGRGKGFKMPKRQFMGESIELNKRIINELQRMLQTLINQTL